LARSSIAKADFVVSGKPSNYSKSLGRLFWNSSSSNFKPNLTHSVYGWDVDENGMLEPNYKIAPPFTGIVFDPQNPPHERHYCRLANSWKHGGIGFHLDWYKGKVEQYRTLYGDDFRLIFYRNQEPMDYYSIPYHLIRSAIPETHLDNRNRWHAYIQGGILKVTKKPHKMATLDISNYFNHHGEEEDEELLAISGIYCIVNPVWPGWRKIGYSQDMWNRLAQYQTYDPHSKYDIESYIEWDKENLEQMEDEIHVILENKKGVVRNKPFGEWFMVSKEVVLSIFNAFDN